MQESGEGADQDLPAWLTVKSYTNSKDLDMNECSYELEGMFLWGYQDNGTSIAKAVNAITFAGVYRRIGLISAPS